MDVVDFLERQVKIATHPVFGDIKDSPTVIKDVRRSKSQTFPRMKESTFATTAVVAEKKKRQRH